MKTILLVVVFVYVAYKTVYGLKLANKAKEIFTLEVEPVDYGPDRNFLPQSEHKKISCKGSHRFQKLNWYNPSGEIVKRGSKGPIFVQEHVATASLKSKMQSLILVFTHAEVSDSGIWECRSGDLAQQVSFCVIEPSQFVDTPSEVTIDEGRSITLTCQSRGNPEPKIQWLRNGKVLSDESSDQIYTGTKYNHHGIEGLLTIKSLTPENSGDYVCETIQKVPELDDCINTDSKNITLNVNHAPRFDEKTENHTANYFAQTNDSVELICDPTAYPTPKFRWFRVIGEMEMEYSEKQFKVSDDGTQSILSVVGNSTTFNQKFKCLVENDYGEAEKTFKLLLMVKPAKISEVTASVATGNTIEFNITWDSDTELFPLDGFEIQYFEKKIPGPPSKNQWGKAKKLAFVNTFNLENEDVVVPIYNLKENTEYWVRFCAVNELGQSPWSIPILASTVSASEDLDDDYDFDSDLMLAVQSEVDVGAFIGVFLTIVIVAFAAVCIFFIKRL